MIRERGLNDDAADLADHPTARDRDVVDAELACRATGHLSRGRRHAVPLERRGDGDLSRSAEAGDVAGQRLVPVTSPDGGPASEGFGQSIEHFLDPAHVVRGAPRPLRGGKRPWQHDEQKVRSPIRTEADAGCGSGSGVTGSVAQIAAQCRCFSPGMRAVVACDA